MREAEVCVSESNQQALYVLWSLNEGDADVSDETVESNPWLKKVTAHVGAANARARIWPPRHATVYLARMCEADGSFCSLSSVHALQRDFGIKL